MNKRPPGSATAKTEAGHTTQRLRRLSQFHAGFAWMGCFLLILSSSIVSLSQSVPSTRAAKGFAASYRTKESPHPLVRFQGAEAIAIGPNLKVKAFRMTKYRQDVEVPELMIEAPECIYDPVVKSAHSSGPMKVTSAAGLYQIEGKGFSWNSETRRLVVTNDLRTTINHQLFLRKKTTP